MLFVGSERKEEKKNRHGRNSIIPGSFYSLFFLTGCVRCWVSLRAFMFIACQHRSGHPAGDILNRIGEKWVGWARECVIGRID